MSGLTNIKYTGKYVITKNGKTLLIGIKELIRIEDMIKCEENYVARRFKEYKDIIDYKAQNAFIKVVSIASLKYVYGFNQHSNRDIMINKDNIKSKCLRYSEPETWDHIVQCYRTSHL